MVKRFYMLIKSSLLQTCNLLFKQLLNDVFNCAEDTPTRPQLGTFRSRARSWYVALAAYVHTIHPHLPPIPPPVASTTAPLASRLEPSRADPKQWNNWRLIWKRLAIPAHPSVGIARGSWVHVVQSTFPRRPITIPSFPGQIACSPRTLPA